MAVDTHRIAGKPLAFLGWDGKSFFLLYARGQHGLGVRIETRGKVEKLSSTEWTKAGIQVVKPLIHQFHRHDFFLENFRQLDIGADITALPVAADPEIWKSQ